MPAAAGQLAQDRRSPNLCDAWVCGGRNGTNERGVSDRQGGAAQDREEGGVAPNPPSPKSITKLGAVDEDAVKDATATGSSANASAIDATARGDR